MAEAGTDWPGFSSDCLGAAAGRISAVWLPRHFLAAAFLPPSRIALVLSCFRAAGPASGDTVPAVFRGAGRCGQRRCARRRAGGAAARARFPVPAA